MISFLISIVGTMPSGNMVSRFLNACPIARQKPPLFVLIDPGVEQRLSSLLKRA